MKRILIAILLLSSPAYAEDCESPCTMTVRVTATNEQIATVSPEICEDVYAPGCDDVTYMPEQAHPCDTNPELSGCAYYNIEPSGGQ